MIRAGDRIVFKPEWQDAGDAALTFVAVTDEAYGRVKVSVMELSGWAIWPLQDVPTHMIGECQSPFVCITNRGVQR